MIELFVSELFVEFAILVLFAFSIICFRIGCMLFKARYEKIKIKRGIAVDKKTNMWIEK